MVFPVPSLNDPHPYPRGLCLLFAPTVMSSTGVSALELESGKQLVHPGAPMCEAQGGQVRWESEGEGVSPVGPPGEGKASSRTPGSPQAGERVPPDATPHQPWERWRLPTDTPEPLAAAPPGVLPLSCALPAQPLQPGAHPLPHPPCSLSSRSEIAYFPFRACLPLPLTVQVPGAQGAGGSPPNNTGPGSEWTQNDLPGTDTPPKMTPPLESAAPP